MGHEQEADGWRREGGSQWLVAAGEEVQGESMEVVTETVVQHKHNESSLGLDKDGGVWLVMSPRVTASFLHSLIQSLCDPDWPFFLKEKLGFIHHEADTFISLAYL